MISQKILALGLMLAACSQKDDEPAQGGLYAVMYEVIDDSGSNSYLSLLNTLELETIDVAQSIEYGGGRAFIQAYNNWLFVGDAETPTVTRYSVTEGGELVEEGTISFANYGLDAGQFDSWNATFISATKAYLLDFREGTTIIWNPSTMEITGDIPAPAELRREGWTLEGSPAAVRDGLLFRTFDWANYDDASYAPDYRLAIYDVNRDALIDIVEETRCPVPGNLVHEDEAGNFYFSNWIWPVAGTIMRGTSQPCVLRIDSGGNTFAADWTLDYHAITGHQGAMFTYLKDGRALISAFHEERTSFDQQTDPWSYVGSLNWEIWSIDLASKTGAPIEGLGFNGGAYTPVQFDGRLFLMVPGGAEENYATQIYELVDGRATPKVKLPGWSYQFVKLR